MTPMTNTDTAHDNVVKRHLVARALCREDGDCAECDVPCPLFQRMAEVALTALATTTQPDTDSGLAGEVQKNSRWRHADWYGGVVFEVPESLFARILTALRTDRKAVLEDGDEVEYLNPDLSYPIKATFRQYVEGWAEIEFWDHSATNPSTAIVRPSRIRNLSSGEAAQ